MDICNTSLRLQSVTALLHFYNDSKTIEIFKGLMPEMSHVGFICTASTIHIYFFSLLSAHYSEPHLNYRRLYVQMLVCDNALQIKKETFID